MIYMEYANYILCVWHLKENIKNKAINQPMLDNDKNIHIYSASIYLALIYVLCMY